MESPKPDLIAIYRLEFYKKKKNWKLSDAKKCKRDKISNKERLNQTYDVEEPKIEISQLNNAFLDTDSDNYASSKQQTTDNIPKDIQESLYVLHDSITTIQEIEQPKDNYQDWMQTEELPEIASIDAKTDIQGYLDAQIEDVQDHPNYRYFDGENQYFQDINGNWKPFPEFTPLCPNDPSQINKGLDCGDNATNTLDWQQKDDPYWLPSDDLHWLLNNVYSYAGVDTDNWELQTRSDTSVDSWGEFVRGADVAPHSSEVELSLPKSLSEADVSANSLACLSSAQLRAAVHAHTNLLRNLLNEENQRRRIRSCLSLTNPTLDGFMLSPRAVTEASSYDDQPTHDYDASIIHRNGDDLLKREKTFTKTFDDLFLAGSYKNEVRELVRGRGRLQNFQRDFHIGNNSQRPCGVGRGRPCKF